MTNNTVAKTFWPWDIRTTSLQSLGDLDEKNRQVQHKQSYGIPPKSSPRKPQVRGLKIEMKWQPAKAISKHYLYTLVTMFSAINSKMSENLNSAQLSRYQLKSGDENIPDYGVLEVHKKTKRLIIIFRGSLVSSDWTDVNLQSDTCGKIPDSNSIGVHCGM
jgi:hypothetical protein